MNDFVIIHDIDFVKAHELIRNLKASRPTSLDQMTNAGFQKPVLDAAKALGLDWLSLIQLAMKYGPQLLTILLDLLKSQQHAHK